MDFGVAGTTSDKNSHERGTRIPDSCLVSVFPLSSGHGRLVELLQNLGLFETTAFFKIRAHDSEFGYTVVVRDLLRLGTPSAFLSLYLPSAWSRYIRNFKVVHFSSPHFFHLVKYNPNATGGVTDLIFLDRSTHRIRDTPVGTRLFFPRVIRFSERLKGVWTISHVVDQQLRALFPRVKSRVIHPWTSYAFTARDRLKARMQLGLPPERKILLNVSIDVERKNIDILPKIVNALDDSFLLVRIGESGRIESQFQAGRLFWLKSVTPDAYPLYFNAADVVLMPSRAEGFGIPIIEALNSMTPVIASNISVFREILGNAYPFFADPDDPKAWSTAIQEAFEVAQSISRCEMLYGRHREYYRPKRGLQEFLNFYEDLGLLGPASSTLGLPTARPVARKSYD